jgi:CO/xanthine dehydrogenase Mo-binding subunit
LKKQTCEIGKNIPRYDAIDKVSGKTEYAVDFYSEDMLWLGVNYK